MINSKILLIICVELLVLILLMKICGMYVVKKEDIDTFLFVLLPYVGFFWLLPLLCKIDDCSTKTITTFFTNEKFLVMSCILLLEFIVCKRLDFDRRYLYALLIFGGYILILVISLDENFGLCDTILFCFFISMSIMILTLKKIPKQPYITRKGKDMTVIINGKKYNTETAEIIHQERKWFGFFGCEAFYKKKNGEFFLYYRPPFFNLFGSEEHIKPLNEVECKKYAEAHFTADDYEKLFGRVEE